MTYQEQLTKILEDYRDQIVMSVEIGIYQPHPVREVRDAINALNREIIGENEIRPQEGPKRNGIDQALRRTRNRLRTGLRQRFGVEL